ncbi:MAG: sigma-70 family RNA polymerase sigma factor [Chloroflexota bacterium]|nr:sigma-70 family RNA polymerase sigma factor [Chloroflexota bacterium]
MTNHSSPKRIHRRTTRDAPRSIPQRIGTYTPGRRERLDANERARRDWCALCDNNLPAAEDVLIGQLGELWTFGEYLRLLIIAAIGIDLETNRQCTDPTLVHNAGALWGARLPLDNPRLVALNVSQAYWYTRILRDKASRPLFEYWARRPELAIRLAGLVLYAEMDRGFTQLEARVLRGPRPDDLPDEYVEMAVADLGANIGAGISLSRNGRLATALAEDQTTLEDELPSALAEAVHAFPDMSDLNKVRNHVANLIAGPDRRAERERRVDVPIDDLPTAEDFEAREMAWIEMRDVLSRAPLTDREREIFALKRQEYSSGEIAEKLGTTANSVDVTVNKARKKLLQTA